MEFAAICPTSRLRDLTDTYGLKYHMCLAQWLHKQDYWKFFYEKARDPGQTVIMDNGTYEGARMPERQLVELTMSLRPQCVVAPDEPHNMQQTEQLAVSFMNRMVAKGWPLARVMVVLHAPPGQLESFMNLYTRMSVYVGWIGFSRLTLDYGIVVPKEVGLPPEATTWVADHHSRRALLAQLLQRQGLWSKSVKHHALGMLNGDVRELPLLAEAGFTGVDSSAPVWRGLQGYSLKREDWIDEPFNPMIQFGTGVKSYAESNLEEVLKACKCPTSKKEILST